MTTEIILKRECGARVKVEYYLGITLGRICSTITISVAIKGKRKFVSIPSDDMMQKNPCMYISAEQQEVMKNNLHKVTDEEIRQVKERTLEEIRKQIM